MPSPIDDLDAPWIWQQLFVLGPSVGAETATDQALGIVTARAEIDNKAQRKLQENETLSFMWDAVLLVGSPTADCIAAVRFLSLLP